MFSARRLDARSAQSTQICETGLSSPGNVPCLVALRELNGTVRYLTIREAALVQGFPRDYEFPRYRSCVMDAIGNAVAVTVAARIGTALRRHTRM